MEIGGTVPPSYQQKRVNLKTKEERYIYIYIYIYIYNYIYGT